MLIDSPRKGHSIVFEITPSYFSMWDDSKIGS